MESSIVQYIAAALITLAIVVILWRISLSIERYSPKPIIDMNPDVKQIVKQYLEEHGFGGLAGDYCGCFVDDLFPCGSDGCERCRAGYRLKLTAENIGEHECEAEIGDDIIVLEKPRAIVKINTKDFPFLKSSDEMAQDLAEMKAREFHDECGDR